MTSFIMRAIWIFVALIPLAAVPQTDSWPVIQPLREERTFSLVGNEEADAPLTVFLKDTKNTPVYKLECHNGNYDDSSAISFSGDFQCALFAIKGEVRTSWNLLATDEAAEQRSDWFNRGRMTSGQVWGECGADPEYGTIRHFRSRGMQITIEYKDFKWFPAEGNRHPLSGFTVVISAVPDATAQSPAAERIKTPRPPKACN
jgi:hypothetical protein